MKEISHKQALSFFNGSVEQASIVSLCVAGERYFACEKSLLFTSGETAVLLPQEYAGTRALLAQLPEDTKKIYGLHLWPQEIIRELYPTAGLHPCWQFVLPMEVPIPADDTSIVELTGKYAPQVWENYSLRHVIPLSYIRDRLEAGPAVGLLEQGELAAFTLTHDEGTMGALEVLPKYRGKGYAQRVTWALVRRLRALQKPCLVQIMQGNTPSLSLAEKMGFVPAGQVLWAVLHENESQNSL